MDLIASGAVVMPILRINLSNLLLSCALLEL